MHARACDDLPGQRSIDLGGVAQWETVHAHVHMCVMTGPVGVLGTLLPINTEHMRACVCLGDDWPRQRYKLAHAAVPKCVLAFKSKMAHVSVPVYSLATCHP